MKVQPFDALIPSLKAGKLDAIISGMSATEERKKSVDFTDEYYKSTQMFLKKKGNNKITSIESLAGKKIGVQLGTIQELEARKIKNKAPNLYVQSLEMKYCDYLENKILK